MKREIKFRMWDGQKMITSDKPFEGSGSGAKEYAVLLYGSVTLFSVYGFEPSTIQEVEVMQWSGLKDKNGVDVYEGDILSIQGQIVSVIWDNETGGFTSSEYIKYADRGWDETFIDHPDSVTVIGNIHQHPHLIA